MKNKGLAFYLLLLSTSAVGLQDSFYFSSTYFDQLRREPFSSFYHEVLRCIPARKMDDLIHQEVMKNPGGSDLQIYAAIGRRMPEIQPGRLEFLKLAQSALTHQRQVLGDQIKALLPDKHEIDGYLEIGTDGTYINSLKERFSGGFKGRTYVMNDKQPSSLDITAYYKRGAFFQNFHFIPSRNFSPISEVDLLTESLDMVTMYVGLHHTPVEQLDYFLDSLNRVLREGGVFIQRDHDLNEINESYVYMAHMTFNLATEVTLEEEKSEYRNFQPLKYWIELVERHGFIAHSERLLQEGDPSVNTLLRFTKINSTDLGDVPT